MAYFMLTLRNWGLWLSLLFVAALILGSWIFFEKRDEEGASRSKGWTSYHSWYTAKKFSIGEAIATLVIVLVVAFGITWLFVYNESGLDDFCYINGYATAAHHHEPWREEWDSIETSTDSKGHTTTSIKHHVEDHPERWEAETTVGDMSISNNTYWNYVKLWGNEQHQSIHHENLTAGRGDAFHTIWHGSEAQVVPITKSVSYINYLKASRDTVERRLGDDSLRNLVTNYPSLIDNGYGPKLNRILCMGGVNPPKDWWVKVDKSLNNANAQYGSFKQCNTLLYMVGTRSPAFADTLETAWYKGKKNDIVVEVGVSAWPKIDWVHVMCWTDEAQFPVKLQNRLMDLGTVEDADAFTKIINRTIITDYKRKPMADYEYLTADVHLPTWTYLVTFGVSTVLALACIYVFREHIN